MAWRIEFDAAAQRELHKLDKTIQRRVLKFLYQGVGKLDDPRKIGERLQGTSTSFGDTASETIASFVRWMTIGLSSSSSASVIAVKSASVEAKA